MPNFLVLYLIIAHMSFKGDMIHLIDADISVSFNWTNLSSHHSTFITAIRWPMEAQEAKTKSAIGQVLKIKFGFLNVVNDMGDSSSDF